MRRWTPLALGCALVFHGPAAATPYTIDTALALQQRGPVRLTADGRYAIVQTFARWDQAPRYDLDWYGTYSLGRLSRVTLRSGAVSPLLDQDPGSGYVAGPISPSGGKIAVYRMTGHDWELGVVETASGKVRWLGVSPELSLLGRTLAWRDEDELVVIVQPDHPVGHRLGYGWQGQARLIRNWTQAAAGRVAVNALGSGRYREIRARGPQKRLLLLSLTKGARVLACGDFIDLEIAPGGRTVAAIANAEDLQDTDGAPRPGTPRSRRRLVLADLRTGTAAWPCPRCDVMLRVLSWSASGQRLLIYGRTAGDWSSGGFHVLDAVGGQVSDLKAPGLRPVLGLSREGAIQASGAWMGETPIVYAQPSETATGRADWYAMGATAINLTARLRSPSPRLRSAAAAGLTVADGDRLWRILPDARVQALDVTASRLLAADAAADTERLVLTPPVSIVHAAVRTDGGLAAALAPGRRRLRIGQDETALAVTPDAGAAILARHDAHGVETLVLRTPRGPDRPLLTLNPGLAAITPARVQAIRHPGPEGQALTSWLYLPPDLKPGQRPPLIVIPYPGDDHPTVPEEHQPGSLRLYNNVQVLVGAGYAVLVPSLPLVAGREPMDGLADQVLAVVDAAAGQAPIDATRLALWGHSYGGYAALALATQSPRFKAIIASAPDANLTSSYAGLSPYFYAVPEGGVLAITSAAWSETGQGRMNGPPWKDPDRYRRNSPITFVDRVQAPVMLITGDLDKDPADAEQMFTSLYRQNKDAILLLYRGESHVVSGPGNVRDEYGRVLSFLSDQIGPGLASPSAKAAASQASQ